MIYEEFVTRIVDGLRQSLEDSVSVQLLHLPRNNGSFRDALCLRRAEFPASPAIYMDEFWQSYQNGLPLSLIEQEILDCHREASKRFHQLSLPLDDFEKVKKLLSIKLIHRDQNAKLLEMVPHQDLLDLAYVYYISLTSEDGPAATALIYWEHLQIWDISPAELHQLALENAIRTMPPQIRSLDDFICDLMLQESLNPGQSTQPQERNRFTDVSPLPMYVLTNRKGYLGAACIAYPHVLESFSERCQGSFLLLPSSIHEMILLPLLPSLNLEQMEQMVREINRDVILPEDRLSDHVYRFDPGRGLSFALPEKKQKN